VRRNNCASGRFEAQEVAARSIPIRQRETRERPLGLRTSRSGRAARSKVDPLRVGSGRDGHPSLSQC
jgi:hypothetical protein